METAFILELIGYGASLLIAISLMMKSLIRLRVLNALGALVFVLYGILIQAYPVAVLNGLIVIIDLYYLLQMLRRQDYFTLMEVAPDSTYLNYFLNFHHNDIEQFFPGFTFEPQGDEMVLFVLRDTIPAGLVILRKQDHTANVLLDYALKDYRDFKIGSFIFDDHADLLLNRGIHELTTRGDVPQHAHYLEQMGFEKKDNGMFHKTLSPHFIRDRKL
jgi:hypothetical protein